MIIILKPGATKQDADEILAQIAAAGLKQLYMPGTERTVLGAIGEAAGAQTGVPKPAGTVELVSASNTIGRTTCWPHETSRPHGRNSR